MIHYALRCGTGHEFDGWFASITGFEAEVHAGRIACPECGETRVSRALMAPAVTRHPTGHTLPAEPPEGVAPSAPAPVSMPGSPPALPAALVARLQRLRATIEAEAEYVGPDFAQTARAMHDGELPARPIYGQTTEAEARALEDDDIPVMTIPWLPRADA